MLLEVKHLTSTTEVTLSCAAQNLDRVSSELSCFDGSIVSLDSELSCLSCSQLPDALGIESLLNCILSLHSLLSGSVQVLYYLGLSRQLRLQRVPTCPNSVTYYQVLQPANWVPKEIRASFNFCRVSSSVHVLHGSLAHNFGQRSKHISLGTNVSAESLSCLEVVLLSFQLPEELSTSSILNTDTSLLKNLATLLRRSTGLHQQVSLLLSLDSLSTIQFCSHLHESSQVHDQILEVCILRNSLVRNRRRQAGSPTSFSTAPIGFSR
ncbi:hypothetical protein D3C78_1153330 [compost metagenome]